MKTNEMMKNEQDVEKTNGMMKDKWNDERRTILMKDEQDVERQTGWWNINGMIKEGWWKMTKDEWKTDGRQMKGIIKIKREWKGW
jgi:hypothetical protein